MAENRSPFRSIREAVYSWTKAPSPFPGIEVYKAAPPTERSHAFIALTESTHRAGLVMAARGNEGSYTQLTVVRVGDTLVTEAKASIRGVTATEPPAFVKAEYDEAGQMTSYSVEPHVANPYEKAPIVDESKRKRWEAEAFKAVTGHSLSTRRLPLDVQTLMRVAINKITDARAGRRAIPTPTELIRDL